MNADLRCGGFVVHGKSVTVPQVLFGLNLTISRWHGRCELRSRSYEVWKGILIMKTVVSFLLGAVMLFGAATLGLQSATANAKDKHDKNYWKHHHQHRHHKHHRHYKNHLSY
jgi:hypothetical protein